MKTLSFLCLPLPPPPPILLLLSWQGLTKISYESNETAPTISLVVGLSHSFRRHAELTVPSSLFGATFSPSRLLPYTFTSVSSLVLCLVKVS